MPKITPLRDSLLSYGLDGKEATIYLYLLQHKDYPAYTIAKDTEIARTTVYKCLDRLEKLGVVSSWIKNGVHHYSAENPEILKRNLEEKRRKIEGALPEMLKMFKFDSIYPSAKLYEGKDGVKQVFENILEIIKVKKLRTLYVYSDYLLTEQFPKYFEEWRKRKNKLETFTHLIVPNGTPFIPEYISNEYRETRIMPENNYFEGSVDICGSHLAFFSFKDGEVYAVTIDSPVISGMLTGFFKYMWTTLPKFEDAVENTKTASVS